MSDTAIFESNEKFARVEERMNRILNRDQGVKTNYSELRNFYSIITNDAKGAIAKRLIKLMVEVNNFNTTYIRGKTPKKDKALAEIEMNFDDHLHSMPDINPQNAPAQYQFLRELMPLFIQIKAHTAKLIKVEKKAKKKKQQEELLHYAEQLSQDVHSVFSVLLHQTYFEQYILNLIRARVNRDYTRDMVRDIHSMIKQTFKTGKNEILDIRCFQSIEIVTLYIRIRLGICEACELYETYKQILKDLPRQLVQQFNARYLALRRDITASIEELKETDEYKDMTKKFITLKLKKYYNLLRLYQVNVNRLFIIEDQVKKAFDDYLEKIEANNTQPREKIALLESMQIGLYDAVGKYLKLDSGLPRNEDLKKNSIRTLFTFVMSYYYNVLKDTYSPLTSREIAIRSMKLVKPPKEMILNATELKLLDTSGFKRDEKILAAYFNGILRLVTGESEENVLVNPVVEHIDEKTRGARKSDLREKAIRRIVAEISPVELDMLVQILETIPRDQERISTDLGKIYIEIAERYSEYLKRGINRLEKVEPTDSEKEKLRKIVTEKYQRLLLKTVEYHVDKPSPVEYLKKVQEEEQAFAAELKETGEMTAGYNIGSLITYWKSETEKTVVGFILGGNHLNRKSGRHRELSRCEVSRMNDYFSSEHLGEIEKQYKTLSENIGQNYLKHPRPHSKIEYILLYAAKRLLVEFRNPAKSYPRLHERLSSISTGK